MPTLLKPWSCFLCLLALLLQSCVFVPATTEIYDQDCRITSKQMALQAVQVGAFVGCRGSECVAALVVMGAATAASAVISGSIVVVGNVVYWFEKKGRCNREQ